MTIIGQWFGIKITKTYYYIFKWQSVLISHLQKEEEKMEKNEKKVQINNLPCGKRQGKLKQE
jgi:hypothetical protein